MKKKILGVVVVLGVFGAGLAIGTTVREANAQVKPVPIPNPNPVPLLPACAAGFEKVPSAGQNYICRGPVGRCGAKLRLNPNTVKLGEQNKLEYLCETAPE